VGVSQISLPMRILLVGAVVFLAAWFTILRPKADTVEPTTTTGPQTTLGKAVDAAKKAAGQEETSKPTEKAATTSKPDVKPAPAVAIPETALAKLPKDVAAAVQARKVIVLGVFADGAKSWRPQPDDDRYVRNALEDVNRYGGKVLVKPVAAGKLSGYGALVNGLGVTQTPSVVVIDRDLKGKVLTGYVDKVAINQVIADARDTTISPRIKDPYLRDVNSVCSHLEVAASRWSLPTVRGKRPRVASAKRLQAIAHRYRARAAGLKAPARYRSFKAAWLKALDVDVKASDALVNAARTGSVADFTALDVLVADSSKAWAAFDKRANTLGVTSCAIVRRA